MLLSTSYHSCSEYPIPTNNSVLLPFFFFYTHKVDAMAPVVHSVIFWWNVTNCAAVIMSNCTMFSKCSGDISVIAIKCTLPSLHQSSCYLRLHTWKMLAAHFYGLQLFEPALIVKTISSEGAWISSRSVGLIPRSNIITTKIYTVYVFTICHDNFFHQNGSLESSLAPSLSLSFCRPLPPAQPMGRLLTRQPAKPYHQ